MRIVESGFVVVEIDIGVAREGIGAPCQLSLGSVEHGGESGVDRRGDRQGVLGAHLRAVSVLPLHEVVARRGRGGQGAGRAVLCSGLCGGARSGDLALSVHIGVIDLHGAAHIGGVGHTGGDVVAAQHEVRRQGHRFVDDDMGGVLLVQGVGGGPRSQMVVLGRCGLHRHLSAGIDGIGDSIAVAIGGERVSKRALPEIGFTISAHIVRAVPVYCAADGHRAAGTSIAPADAVYGIRTLCGNHLGHAIGDGDGAAIGIRIARSNTSSTISTCGSNGAARNADVAA